jgi:hypothetical protein
VDNGTEFKGKKLGEFAPVCLKRRMKIIRGRSRHPQTQGSVEIANKVFKRRLRAIQVQLGTRKWVQFLPEIAFVLNTTPSKALPNNMTPYEAHYGRPPPNWDDYSKQEAEDRARKQAKLNGEEVMQPSDLESESGSDNNETDIDTNDDQPFLTTLGKRIAAHHQVVANRMVKERGGKQEKVKLRQIVLLEVPRQLRTSVEPSRIPARVCGLTVRVSISLSFENRT